MSCARPKTALHLAAKNILAEAARAYAGMTVPGQKKTGLRSAELEVRIPSGRVVDVMVRTIGPMYAIEIAVTHRKSSPAAADIVGDGYRGLEIDLSGVSASAAREEVRRAVLHEAPRHWLEAPRPAMAVDTPGDQPRPRGIKRRSEQGREILTYIHAQLERHPEYYACELAWPVLRARGARFTASLDMTDAMRAACRVSPSLMAVDNIQFEQVSEEGGLQLMCYGGVGTATNSALVLVSLYIASLGPAPVDKNKPTLMIGCPDDLNCWESCLSMHWEGIGKWQARLEKRWATAIQKE